MPDRPTRILLEAAVVLVVGLANPHRPLVLWTCVLSMLGLLVLMVGALREKR